MEMRVRQRFVRDALFDTVPQHHIYGDRRVCQKEADGLRRSRQALELRSSLPVLRCECRYGRIQANLLRVTPREVVALLPPGSGLVVVRPVTQIQP